MKGHRIAIYIALVLCVINQIAFTCVLCFACSPVRITRDQDDRGARANIYDVPDCFPVGPNHTGWEMHQRGRCILWYVDQHWQSLVWVSLTSILLAFAGLAATTLAFDIVIIALPIPVLAKLQISSRKKVRFFP